MFLIEKNLIKLMRQALKNTTNNVKDMTNEFVSDDRSEG